MLSARFHINIGIYYEDNGDYIRSYEYFKDWAEICTEVRDWGSLTTRKRRMNTERPDISDCVTVLCCLS